jgi:hypothetical protein
MNLAGSRDWDAVHDTADTVNDLSASFPALRVHGLAAQG